ncbi:MAG: UDP-3-O-(3-hydroxymyristoyl)glucosamine N-acyltransferase [Bacteroidota bacterium]
MKFRIGQIAAWLGGTVEGDETVEVHTLAKIEEGTPGAITFLANPKYTPFIYQTKASAVIVREDFQPSETISAALIRVADPYSAFTQLLEMADQAREANLQGIDPRAHVSASATIGENVYIGPFAFIGEGVTVGAGAKIHPFVFVGERCQIGAQTTIHAHATIYHYCEIGKKCIIHAGAVVGSDGFGFAPQEDGTLKKIPQTGNVVLADEVEIGANATLDRATMGSTQIQQGVKIDNLVQIAHNVTLGPHSAIAAQTGIAGSTRMGAHCMVGGQVGIVGHLEIANRTQIDAQSGVNKSIKQEGRAFRGSPIQPFRQQLKSEVLFRKLEEMSKRIESLERALAQKES